MDSDVQKILMLVMKKWKVVVALALAGMLAAVVFTANFVTSKYTSTVVFLAYVQDEEKDQVSVNNAVQYTATNTSKMNYAQKMLNTYVRILNTNQFFSKVNDDSYNKYGVRLIKTSVNYSIEEETAIFSASVTTTDPNVSKEIADVLEQLVPQEIYDAQEGLVRVKVIDPPLKANTAVSLNYSRNAILGAAVGVVLAIGFVLLKDLLDIRVRNENDLNEKYAGIAVLGSVPDFEMNKGSRKGADD